MGEQLARFDVRGEPEPQPRPRLMRVGRVSRIYNPPDADRWREAVAAAARLAWRGPPTKQPLDVRIAVYKPRPQYLRKASADPGPIPLAVRGAGDADNYAKAILDAMEGIVFDNDAQAARVVVEKYWAAMGATPGAVVMVLEFESSGARGLFSEAGGSACST